MGLSEWTGRDWHFFEGSWLPPAQNDSRSRHPMRPEWVLGSFRPVDGVGQAVWKSGGNGSGGGFDPLRDLLHCLVWPLALPGSLEHRCRASTVS